MGIRDILSRNHPARGVVSYTPHLLNKESCLLMMISEERGVSPLYDPNALKSRLPPSRLLANSCRCVVASVDVNECIFILNVRGMLACTVQTA